MYDADEVRNFYAGYHDEIIDKRLQSPYWVRRWAHETIYERSVERVHPGERVLDAGAGEGGLSVRLAVRASFTVALDLSVQNLQGLRRLGGADIPAVVADLQHLPFRDDAFDVVVSSHAVEHCLEPVVALREMGRVAADRSVVAMPTCGTPAAWLLVGGANYWRPGRRTPSALARGIARTIVARARREEGPQEPGYGGGDVPHLWRFPRAMKALFRQASLSVDEVVAGPLLIPYLGAFPPARAAQRLLDRHLRALPGLRWMGLGTHFVLRRPSES